MGPGGKPIYPEVPVQSSGVTHGGTNGGTNGRCFQNRGQAIPLTDSPGVVLRAGSVMRSQARPPQGLFRVGGRDGMGLGVSFCGATGAFGKRGQAIPLTYSPGALLRAGGVGRLDQGQTKSGHRGGWPVNPVEPPQALYGVGCGMGLDQGRAWSGHRRGWPEIPLNMKLDQGRT